MNEISSKLHFEYWFFIANMHKHEYIQATFLCVYMEIRCIENTKFREHEVNCSIYVDRRAINFSGKV